MPFTVTVTEVNYNNRIHYFARILETDLNVGEEYSVTGLPTNGEIVAFGASTVAGSLLQPAFGRASGFDPTDTNDINNITQQGAAARTYINDQSSVRYYNLTDGTLWGQSTVDVQAIGTTTTEILIVGGMQV